ncbi:hypothetical protein EG359_11185 [Chryseobacterium joostei]|uniref:Uncharacterized protein n=1 Tax=Chryseobacterium joostei TaxID=112234 RepID=A0A1N7IGP9_9FLAO|nr:hypothetical protein [Chryseobacterium joostei]AZB00152.1 hypothetical protein EG359_11185 [Chryseobacterium joostei]SIS36284.1 hypothetical protein SAMN05421768_105158 [Chryseobacterium joostei]
MKNIYRKNKIKSKKSNVEKIKTFDFKELEKKIIMAEINYQLEQRERLISEAKDFYFEVDSEEQIWGYKDSEVVADIYVNEEWKNKISVETDINPYSDVTFEEVDKALRDFLFNEWSKKQFKKLETIEPCMSRDLDKWKDS